MDFSPKALDYSRRVFEREQLTANFLEGDIREPSAPGFDLVFNAGVIEHYTFDEQADLLRSMAGRSRRYVPRSGPQRVVLLVLAMAHP